MLPKLQRNETKQTQWKNRGCVINPCGCSDTERARAQISPQQQVCADVAGEARHPFTRAKPLEGV